MTANAPFDPWRDFTTLTAARIALGRAGGSVPTRELLDFGLAHARARDAVQMPFDSERLAAEFESAGMKTLLLESAARDREQFLRRPDLGRRLSDASRTRLNELAGSLAAVDLCLIISDGLSSRSTHHARSVLAPLHMRLCDEGWNLAPVTIVRFGRVAIQDEIGERLRAALSLIVLGERPGLGSTDSLGAYFVYAPQVGRSDAERNCVSNIHPHGLTPATAVETLHYLLNAARHRRLSGVSLKDERVLTASTRTKLSNDA